MHRSLFLIRVRGYGSILTGLFIVYALLIPGWTLFCLQKSFKSSENRINKVLETFRDLASHSS